MKKASDFRAMARQTLAGRWGIAVLAGLLASILGGATSGLQINLNFNESEAGFAGQQFPDFSSFWNEELTGLLVGIGMIVFWVALVFGVAYFILGSVVGVGYCKFNLDLVDRQKEPEIGTLFSYFAHWKTTAVANLLQTVYVFLWMLLFIIPGIVASYSYAMTSYILAEHPEMTAREAIERSKTLMFGNRKRLFFLHLSFIGWDILAALTFGLGNLWLMPYKHAATAAFYREITGRGYITEAAEPLVED